ncbi:MAG TPA: tyrosine-type recombinase/integrase, partial [Pseudonocardiaceae bacterium]
LLPQENGRPLDRRTVTRLINKAAVSAGLGHIHPHQLRHTLATLDRPGDSVDSALRGSTDVSVG